MTSDKMRPVVLFKYLDSKGHIEKSRDITKCSSQSRLVKEALQVFNYTRKCCKDVVSFPTEHENSEYWYNDLDTCIALVTILSLQIAPRRIGCRSACATKPLIKLASAKSFFWAPAVYHGWPVKKIYIYIIYTVQPW